MPKKPLFSNIGKKRIRTPKNNVGKNIKQKIGRNYRLSGRLGFGR